MNADSSAVGQQVHLIHNAPRCTCEAAAPGYLEQPLNGGCNTSRLRDRVSASVPLKYIPINGERANSGWPQNPWLARQVSLDFALRRIILGGSLRVSNLSHGLPGTCPACGGHFFALSAALDVDERPPLADLRINRCGHTTGTTGDTGVSVAFS